LKRPNLPAIKGSSAPEEEKEEEEDEWLFLAVLKYTLIKSVHGVEWYSDK
jgi:hypothetical protein